MSRSLESLRASNVPSPALLEAVAKRNLTATFDDPITRRQARADHLAALRHLMPLGGKAIPEVEERDIHVTVRDGYEVRVRVYTPVQDRQVDGGGPLVLMFHEGGFMNGDLTDEEMNCRLFSREFGAICGNVEYRLAPEYLFPYWIHDCIDVAKWLARNAALLGSDPSKGFIVGGSSAGGNISAVLAQLSRLGEFEAPITGQYLSVPLIAPLELFPTKYKEELLSPYENLNDPVLRYVGAQRLKETLGILKADPNSHLYSPLAPPSYPPDAAPSVFPLAPAYMQVSGLDPLRDHALIYDRILREEYGVESQVDLYAGFGHMFWTNWPELKESHDFVSDTVKGIRRLLQRKAQHLTWVAFACY